MTDGREPTPGPWRAVALGGCSTVVAPSRPRRNDTTVPAFGYDDAQGHCIAYPFIDDDGCTRKDFVCFSHDDARLIAAAPAMRDALRGARQALDGLFARLIVLDPKFFPSESRYWPAIVAINDALLSIPTTHEVPPCL